MEFTVVDIIRGLGYEPEAPVSWEIGAAVRDAYEALTSHPPPKGLRRKSSGSGSHCFALYPETFRAQAVGIARARLEAAAAATRAQGELF